MQSWLNFPLLLISLHILQGSSLYAADPVAFSVGTFSFQRPEGWAWVVPSSQMRKAELAVAGEGGTKAEVTFFHFGAGQGGGVDANVARWLSQFSEPVEVLAPKIEAGSIGSIKITFVRARGTFLSGMPGSPTTPLTGYGLLGAILEDPVGGDVFVKMTGPTALVDVADPAFDAMIKKAGASANSPAPSLP